ILAPLGDGAWLSVREDAGGTGAGDEAGRARAAAGGADPGAAARHPGAGHRRDAARAGRPARRAGAPRGPRRGRGGLAGDAGDRAARVARATRSRLEHRFERLQRIEVRAGELGLACRSLYYAIERDAVRVAALLHPDRTRAAALAALAARYGLTMAEVVAVGD